MQKKIGKGHGSAQTLSTEPAVLLPTPGPVSAWGPEGHQLSSANPGQKQEQGCPSLPRTVRALLAAEVLLRAHHGPRGTGGTAIPNSCVRPAPTLTVPSPLSPCHCWDTRAEEDHDHNLLRDPGHRHRLHLRRHFRLDLPPRTVCVRWTEPRVPWGCSHAGATHAALEPPSSISVLMHGCL